MAVSPDGSRIVFIARTSEGKTLLWVRPLDSLSAQPLAGTENASSYAFWSPDGRVIGFFADGKLKKIEASGGPVQTLYDAPGGRGGTWNRDGTIVFAPGGIGGLYRISTAGGAAVPLTKPDESRKETTHRWPFFLPDGRHFLYLARSRQAENTAIFAGSLDSAEKKLIVRADSNPQYAPTGNLLFWRERNLMAQPFEPKRLEVTGDALPVAERVEFIVGLSLASFSVSENAVLIYRTGGEGKLQLRWFDRSGKQMSSVGQSEIPNPYGPRLSPDGRILAVTNFPRQVGERDIWLCDLARAVRTRLTFTANNTYPVWSPDGSQIIFASYRKGHFDLYQKAASLAGQEEILLESDKEKEPTDWSRDGRYIAYDQYDQTVPNTKRDIWILPLLGDRKPFTFLRTSFEKRGAAFSPDGGWLAYQSNEAGKDDIYVTPFPNAGAKWQVSNGGTQPRWSRDGKELFYLSADSKITTVEVRPQGSGLQIGLPRPLFEVQVSLLFRVYDVSPDGKRFIVSTLSQANAAPITLVTNWTAGLKK